MPSDAIEPPSIGPVVDVFEAYASYLQPIDVFSPELCDGGDDRVTVAGFGMVVNPDQRAAGETMIVSPFEPDQRV
jgi:hypothetical protein